MRFVKTMVGGRVYCSQLVRQFPIRFRRRTMVFQSSTTMIKQHPHAAVGVMPFVGSFDYVMAPPSSRQEPINVIDVEACCSSYHGLCLQDAHEVSKMLSSSEAWGALDELDDTVWMKGARPTTTVVQPPPRQAKKARSKIRTRRVKCADELARRHAHRRSLQKGYERDYRQRKRQNRDFLRQEWFCLEQELKIALVAAQNRALRSSGVASAFKVALDSPVARGLEDLRRESQALGIENLVLQCALSSEERLADARDYFTQSQLRERLNQTSGTPWLFQFEFSWQ